MTPPWQGHLEERSDERSVSLDNIKHIIAVSSCKGGVGKSTIAAHLANELNRRGHKVGLVDADIHGPSVPALFGLHNETIHANAQQQLIPVEKNGLKIMSFGFLLNDAAAVMRGPMVTRYVQQLLLNTQWGELDYLLIDMPPGTGDVALTITQQVKLSGAVIVTTPQTLSLLDVSRGILMFEKVNVPVLGVIENMASFQCPDCHSTHEIFGSHTETLKQRFGIEILARIPVLKPFIYEVDSDVSNEFIVAAADRMLSALKNVHAGQTEHPQVTVEGDQMMFTWKSGEQLIVKNRDLRANCRCARCVNEMTGRSLLDPSKIRADIAPLKIIPLGNYALGITWNDGHASGIYPFTLIREVAQKTASPEGKVS
ncbi:MAG: sodium:proton antiporter [Candidatus Omnitrophica bacterium CG12_big_fil_rev_8_21_14_0_65_50_5]|nr:MAG: sodium:proton antiporter [Candidatus Omnitrophica bacterium CG12_big_fil_rev_8_21_14_0_65_50_5]